MKQMNDKKKHFKINCFWWAVAIIIICGVLSIISTSKYSESGQLGFLNQFLIRNVTGNFYFSLLAPVAIVVSIYDQLIKIEREKFFISVKQVLSLNVRAFASIMVGQIIILLICIIMAPYFGEQVVSLKYGIYGYIEPSYLNYFIGFIIYTLIFCIVYSTFALSIFKVSHKIEYSMFLPFLVSQIRIYAIPFIKMNPPISSFISNSFDDGSIAYSTAELMGGLVTLFCISVIILIISNIKEKRESI